MTKAEKAAILSNLESRNRLYREFNQSEHSTQKFMAEHGHPYAEEYKILRQYFDSLKYASNSSERLIAFKNDSEMASYGAPDLEMSWNPVGVEGFYYLYPAHKDWMAYLQKASELGWPEGTDPKVGRGRMHVKTSDPRLVGALFTHSEGQIKIGNLYGPDERKILAWELDVKFESAKSALLCFKDVEKYMKAYLLPKRSPKDNVRDAVPTPLCEKSFMLANVSQVTVTDHAVHVPLIPLDSDAIGLICFVLSDLKELWLQGFPYKGDSRDWVEKLVTPKTLRELDKQFL